MRNGQLMPMLEVNHCAKAKEALSAGDVSAGLAAYEAVHFRGDRNRAEA